MQGDVIPTRIGASLPRYPVIHMILPVWKQICRDKNSAGFTTSTTNHVELHSIHVKHFITLTCCSYLRENHSMYELENTLHISFQLVNSICINSEVTNQQIQSRFIYQISNVVSSAFYRPRPGKYLCLWLILQCLVCCKHKPWCPGGFESDCFNAVSHKMWMSTIHTIFLHGYWES